MAKKAINKVTGIIKARILDFSHGAREFSRIQMIRIKSKEYSLLLMEDYFPIIGQVDGNVELVLKDGLVSFEHIKGFFMHRDNEFSLLVESQQEDPVEEEADANG